MWKPTKKQHLTNKKYVDEHGGGSGSLLIITGNAPDERSQATFEPIEPNLSAPELLGALVVVTVNGEWHTTMTITGVNKPNTEGFLDLNPSNNVVLTYELSTGAVTMS